MKLPSEFGVIMRERRSIQSMRRSRISAGTAGSKRWSAKQSGASALLCPAKNLFGGKQSRLGLKTLLSATAHRRQMINWPGGAESVNHYDVYDRKRANTLGSCVRSLSIDNRRLALSHQKQYRLFSLILE